MDFGNRIFTNNINISRFFTPDDFFHPKKLAMKNLILMMIFLSSGISLSFSQNNATAPPTGKTDQSELYNNFYLSYGIGSLFYYIDNHGLTANSTSGNFQLGYSRSVNKVVAVGFQALYSQVDRAGTQSDLYYPSSYSQETATDRLWQGLACLSFHYMNRRAFCMYSGFGIGVTMNSYTQTNYSGILKKGQQLLPAAQLTLLGFRIGRTISFFGEFGIGTSSILNAGISYKFGDNL